MFRLISGVSRQGVYKMPLRSLFIQTAETPNVNALKFVPSMQILPEGITKEFLSGREAACSPLAVRLFAMDGIKSVMFGSNFITIEKHNAAGEWMVMKPEIFAILTEFLNNGTPVLSEEVQLNDLEIQDDDDEIVSMIKELIFTRIRPAIQDDGGDIEFVEFKPDNGTVYLRLKGACRSCDSSSVTLKNGIESMLKHYIEEVQSVEPIDEEVEEEEVAAPQFEAATISPASRGPPPSL
ncbi:nifU-like protein, mitochondrial [Diutina catenulata]